MALYEILVDMAEAMQQATGIVEFSIVMQPQPTGTLITLHRIMDVLQFYLTEEHVRTCFAIWSLYRGVILQKAGDQPKPAFWAEEVDSIDRWFAMAMNDFEGAKRYYTMNHHYLRR